MLLTFTYMNVIRIPERKKNPEKLSWNVAGKRFKIVLKRNATVC
jgi:hypothetical protein